MKIRTKYVRLLPLLILLLGTSSSLRSQIPADLIELSPTQTGRAFMLAFPSPLENKTDARFPNKMPEHIQVTVYSDQANSVVVRNMATGSENIIALPRKTTTTIDLTIDDHTFVDSENGISSNVFSLRSRLPVYVTCHMITRFGTEAWTPLPVESWGTEYYAAMSPSEQVVDIVPESEMTISSFQKGAPSQIIIVAALDNTTVHITPVDELDSTSAGTTVIHLDAGEAYLLMSDVSENQESPVDLAGTKISSNRLIEVFSGNTRASNIVTQYLSGNSGRGLMMEAIAPVEQHGTEFVYTPAYDEYRLPANSNDVRDHRDHEELRIYGTSAGRTNGTISTENGSPQTFRVSNRDYYQVNYTNIEPHVIRTDQPAQAFQNTASMYKFMGTTGSGTFIGSSYRALAPQLVEITPREQWESNGVVRVQSAPVTEKHYMTVITNQANANNVEYMQSNSPGQLFRFNHGLIPGSDYVWGTITINSGVDYFVRGLNGAEFTGYVYGTGTGYELYRPGSARDDDSEKGSSIASAHPSEYEEVVSTCYALPLTPGRRSLNGGRNAIITGEEKENGLLYTVRLEGESSTGLRSIALDPESENLQLEYVSPSDPLELINMDEATVRVSRVDATKPGNGSLVVTDRTGTEKVESIELALNTSSVATATTASESSIVAGMRSRTEAFVRFNSITEGDAMIELFDTRGHRVASMASSSLISNGTDSIFSTTELAAGYYVVVVTVDGSTYTTPLIVR